MGNVCLKCAIGNVCWNLGSGAQFANVREGGYLVRVQCEFIGGGVQTRDGSSLAEDEEHICETAFVPCPPKLTRGERLPVGRSCCMRELKQQHESPLSEH